jgi:hypothetical protein
MSQAPETQVIGVFKDRGELETAIEMLQSRGLERSQLAILSSADTIRDRLGLRVAEPVDPGLEVQAPVDESEKQNITPLLAGVPAYLGAVLAAGAAVASGGTLAGVAVAALLGGAGGSAIGAGAAGALRSGIEESYADQLAQGGILLLIHPRSQDDVATAKAVLAEHADRTVEMPPDRSMT